MAEFDFEVDSEWVHLSYKEAAAMRDVYGFSGTQGTIQLEGLRFIPSKPSRTLLMYDPAQENRCRDPDILISLNEVRGVQSLA